MISAKISPKKPLLLALFLAFNLLATSSFAMSPEEGLESLQPQEVVFEAWFENNVTSESFAKISKLNKKQKTLLLEYQKFLRKKKRQLANKNFQKVSHNPNFFGDPNHTLEPSCEELTRYNTILNALKQLHDEKMLSDDTFDVVNQQLTALRVWHQHNPAIARELNNSASSSAGPSSLTYRKAFNEYLPVNSPPSLHIEKNALGIPFQEKPTFLLNSLWEAFAFAHEHSLIAEFFEALASVSGCLEAHCGAASDWYHKTQELIITGKNSVSGTEKFRKLLCKDYLNQEFSEETSYEKALRLGKHYFQRDTLTSAQIEFVFALILEAEGETTILYDTPDHSDDD